MYFARFLSFFFGTVVNGIILKSQFSYGLLLALIFVY